MFRRKQSSLTQKVAKRDVKYLVRRGVTLREGYSFPLVAQIGEAAYSYANPQSSCCRTVNASSG
jgi:hypothetical protein